MQANLSSSLSFFPLFRYIRFLSVFFLLVTLWQRRKEIYSHFYRVIFGSDIVPVCEMNIHRNVSTQYYWCFEANRQMDRRQDPSAIGIPSQMQ